MHKLLSQSTLVHSWARKASLSKLGPSLFKLLMRCAIVFGHFLEAYSHQYFSSKFHEKNSLKLCKCEIALEEQRKILNIDTIYIPNMMKVRSFESQIHRI